MLNEKTKRFIARLVIGAAFLMLCIALGSLVSRVAKAADADTTIISSHNEQHVAEQAARDLLRKEGCAWTNTTRPVRFRLVRDADGIRVLGNELMVVCIEKPAGPSAQAKVLISWDHPTTRADGTALSLDEIQGYLVVFSGVEFPVGKETRLLIEGVDVGDHPVQLFTIDTRGQPSKPAQLMVPVI